MYHKFFNLCNEICFTFFYEIRENMAVTARVLDALV